MDCEQISRPQPVGILAPPEGLLLWPQEQAKAIWESGERTGQPILTDTPLGRYNRFVLEPDLEVYRALQEELSEEFTGLLHLAAFTGGVASQPPEPFGHGEFLGLCRLIRASWFFEQGEPEKAINELKAGVESSREASPLLAAQMLSHLADSETGPHKVLCYQEAIRLAGERNLVVSELWLSLGITYQQLAQQGQRGPLVEAVSCYQRALQYFSKEEHPQSYALAQNNMALAYLSMPMTEASDQLRMGVAVYDHPAAPEIYTLENAPAAWASAQMNLANSLQYLPSAHPEKNLAEAVEIYEQLLPLRDPETDPLGHARLLANQANALAHLGVFLHAREKFTQSREFFLKGGDGDSARAVEEQLEALPVEKESRLGAL